MNKFIFLLAFLFPFMAYADRPVTAPSGDLYLSASDDVYTDKDFGIGTKDPGSELDISVGSSDIGPTLRLSSTPDNSGDVIGQIDFYDLSSTAAVGARIMAQAVGAGSTPDLRFFTNSNTGSGGTTNLAERMRITSAGRIGIFEEDAPDDTVHIKENSNTGSPGIIIENPISAGAGSTGSTEIQFISATVTGSILLGGPYGGTFQQSLAMYGDSGVDLEFWANGAQAGYVDTSGDWYRIDNDASWSTTSDIRLKDIVSDLPYGLDEISKINPFVYKFKKDNPYGYDSKTKHIGMSAQELEKIIPEAVRTDSKGYKSITNDSIFWTMINSIKQLKTQNNLLKAWACKQPDYPEQLCKGK